MFKKVLVASDLSQVSDILISKIKQIGVLGAEQIILFYALSLKPGDRIEASLEEFVKPRLEKQLKAIEESGFQTKLIIAHGFPADEIQRVSTEEDVSLVIIGSHGENLLTHMFSRLGSVASEILHSHQKPLLVIRIGKTEMDKGEELETTHDNLLKKILFTTDFSYNSYRAFTYVEKLTEDGAKYITLMHVQDKTIIEKHLMNQLERFNQIDKERLEVLKEKLLKSHRLKVKIEISFGLPTEEILKESQKDYSLIVMGSQGRGFFYEIFIGSVSHNVVRNTITNVLLIPGK